MSPAEKTKNMLFDAYQNIKNGTEILSIKDLEQLVELMHTAKEEARASEQLRLQQAERERLKNIPRRVTSDGKVVHIPNTVKILNKNAFRGDTALTKVVIGNSVTQIGENAFEGCTNLREVVFPKRRILLRRECFKGCTSLESVNIPNVANIAPRAFEGCTGLRAVSLPASISNIYSGVFKDCYALSEVTFSKDRPSYYWDSITLYPSVFENCISLERITIPCAFVNEKAFIGCSNLKEVCILGVRPYKRQLVNCKATLTFA